MKDPAQREAIYTKQRNARLEAAKMGYITMGGIAEITNNDFLVMIGRVSMAVQDECVAQGWVADDSDLFVDIGAVSTVGAVGGRAAEDH